MKHLLLPFICLALSGGPGLSAERAVTRLEFTSALPSHDKLSQMLDERYESKDLTVREMEVLRLLAAGSAIGLALTGQRPVAEIMTINFALLTLDQAEVGRWAAENDVEAAADNLKQLLGFENPDDWKSVIVPVDSLEAPRAVGIAIVGQTMYSATMERLREYGTLKALGMSNGALAGIIVRQALIAGLLGYVLASALSYYLGKYKID